MPLIDHFRPPLSEERCCNSFRVSWAASLFDLLNCQLLPRGYYAELLVHRVERSVISDDVNAGELSNWQPAPPSLTFPTVFPRYSEVVVFSEFTGPVPLGVIALVGDMHKANPRERRAFAIKCANYLGQGIGLILIDIVTCNEANLHNEIMRLLFATEEYRLPVDNALYAVAYRPTRRDDKEEIDIWPSTFAIGDRLPTLPLWLHWEIAFPIDLEATYMDARRRLRLL